MKAPELFLREAPHGKTFRAPKARPGRQPERERGPPGRATTGNHSNGQRVGELRPTYPHPLRVEPRRFELLTSCLQIGLIFEDYGLDLGGRQSARDRD
ncbi:hypothetical protein GCM10020220_068370 [Nonomuraea rubra]